MMKQPVFSRLTCLVYIGSPSGIAVTTLVVVLQTMLPRASGVEIDEVTREGRPHFQITTEQATWYYDRGGGGFSGLVDRDGTDWIAFHRDPLSEYPASAAAGYRGMPNAVFVGPDKGAGHPGFDQCHSTVAGENVIRTTSRSGKWVWSWRFDEFGASFTMEQADPEHAWWFLYEGPIEGTFSPQNKVWGTDLGGPRLDVPDSSKQVFDRWRWVYFGDRRGTRVMLIVQRDADDLPDTLWYLGSTSRGSATAPDGMVVFGFGRGPGTKPQFRGGGQRFRVSFIEQVVESPAHHERLAERARGILAGQ